MHHDRIRRVCISIISAFVLVQAAETGGKKFGTEFSGYTFIEVGEVMKGYRVGGGGGAIDHRWMETACIGLFSETRIDEHLKVLMGFEGLLGFPFTIYNQKGSAYVPFRETRNFFWVSRGEGLYTFGDTAGTSLQIEAGYFPYKYNNEVRNLGEYIFRTMCYPPVMINQFDRTFTELLGFRVGNTLRGLFHHDLIFYSDVKQYPYNDFSLAYLADIKNPRLVFVKQNFITLGAGVNLYRLIPVRGDLTNPENPNNALNHYYDTVSKVYNAATNDTTYGIDSGWTTYAGTKLMGRATIDFKKIIPLEIFGPEDLKLYGEVAVLGWKNYPFFYEERKERTPVTIGFNFPTLKILRILDIDILDKIIDIVDLDLLNAEAEYLDSKNVNSIRQPFYNLVPIPYPEDPTNPHERLKWSVYAKKKIGKRMSISAQIANDHIMPKSLAPDEAIQDYTDVTYRHGDWWWNIRTRFDF